MQTRIVIALIVSVLAATLAWPAQKAQAFPEDSARIRAIFAAHDRLQPGLEEYMSHVADDVILMPNGARAIEGKPAYRKHVEEFYSSGTIQIRHEVVEVYSFAEVVLVRGRAVGSFTAPGQQETNRFETKNVFVFRRSSNGELRVWQIIYNDSPASA